MVQFKKRALNENQFTSNQTCLLLRDKKNKKILSDLYFITLGALVDF